jgi:RNA-directed DNA polymerase
MRSRTKIKTKKPMSLSLETIRIRHQVREWTKSGRKHWDIHRYLWNPFILFDATRLVIKNAGSAGIDGESILNLQGREWEVVQSLGEEIKAKEYRPHPVKRVFIPKRDKSLRPLGIPRVRDRIVQRALVLLLEPIYEQKFHEFSYGFRPKRRAVDCVAKVAASVYRQRHVLEADIEKFFDQVNHQKLMKFMRQEVVDSRTLKLIGEYLRVGFIEPGKPWQGSKEGTPQGGPLSPLLANIYLHYALDERFYEVFGKTERVKLFRYADDFVIVAASRTDLDFAERLLRVWIKEADLNLKENKTSRVDMTNGARSHESKFDFLGFKIHLRSYRDNPNRFWIARQPSERSRRELKLRIRDKIQPYLNLKEAKLLLQQIWRGWCEYFRYSNANRIFYREAKSVRRLTWRYLKRKFRRTNHPVGFRRLIELVKDLISNILPLPLKPNHVSQRGQHDLHSGGA